MNKEKGRTFEVERIMSQVKDKKMFKCRMMIGICLDKGLVETDENIVWGYIVMFFKLRCCNYIVCNRKLLKIFEHRDVIFKATV